MYNQTCQHSNTQEQYTKKKKYSLSQQHRLNLSRLVATILSNCVNIVLVQLRNGPGKSTEMQLLL